MSSPTPRIDLTMPHALAPQPPQLTLPQAHPHTEPHHGAGCQRDTPCNPPPGDINNHVDQNINPVNKKRRCANINIASLNINGFSANRMSHLEKWSMINQMLNKNKIVILALQETHLDQERVESLKSAFGRKMEIIHSEDPDAPHATTSVAFVINKSLIAPKKTTIHEIRPGRVLQIQIDWLDNETTSLMNIYAPNERAAHQTMWTEVEATRCWRNRFVSIQQPTKRVT